MAKYDVTYTCGHTETVELFGKTSERERKIEWMEGNCLCPSCYKEKQQEEAKAFDLPALTGTPRQVAWAETLRNGVFEKLEFEKLARGKNPTDEFVDWLKGQTESRFWIDNKGASVSYLQAKWDNKQKETKLEGTPKQVAWAEKIREELTAVVEENMGQEWFGLNALDLETSAATIISYHTDYKGRFDDLLEALAKRAKEL